MTEETLHGAFRFVIELDGEAIGAFTECALPSIEWEVEEIKEGGLNTHIHQLPGRRKSAKITLKNGVGFGQSLVDWYLEYMNEGFSRKRVTVSLLDMQQEAIMEWEIAEAYPLKWSGPSLKSGESAVAIQELQLACGEITME